MKLTLTILLLALSLAHTLAAARDSIIDLFDNPVAKRATIDHLGRRDTSKNGLPYPTPGTTVPQKVPQAWLDKLKQVDDAGKIPKIPPSKANNATGNVDYPAGISSSDVCNWTNTQCMVRGSINDAPDKMVGLAFDDGPVTEVIEALHPMMKKHNVSMSHFLIGSQIMWDLPAFHKLATMDPPQHLGVHTFTHTQMTTHTNEDVVADIGWSMQLVYDYSGKMPLYWRAPEGDVDNRVFAIAKEVFGLQLVFWNRDPFDWCILNDGQTYAGSDACHGITKDSIKDTIAKWTASGEGIIPLMHEVRVSSVNPIHQLIESASNSSYTFGPIPFLQSLPWYANADTADATGTQESSILPKRPPFDITDSGTKADGTKLSDPWHNVKTDGSVGSPGTHIGGSGPGSSSDSRGPGSASGTAASSSLPSTHSSSPAPATDDYTAPTPSVVKTGNTTYGVGNTTTTGSGSAHSGASRGRVTFHSASAAITGALVGATLLPAASAILL
ncbi:unnamed protein product [Parajaminaea phylloscopi]